MNKLISKIVGVALGLTLAAGTGVAIATSNRSVSKTSAAGYNKASSLAVGDKVVIVCEGASMEMTSYSSTSTVYGIGTSYSGSPAGTLEFTVESGSTTGTYAFKNGSDYLYWTSGNSLNKNSTKSNNTSWNVTFDTDGNAAIVNAADSARQIWWNVSSPRFACYTGKTNGSSYKYTQIYKLDATAVSLSVDKPSISVRTGGTSTTITATASGGTGSVSWATEDTDLFSLSAATGNSITVNGLAVGTGSITVSYSTATPVTVSVEVFSISTSGTESDPYSVADARKMIDSGVEITNVHVAGIIYKIDEISTEHGNATYWISDDGSSSNGLEVYRGKGLNNAAFTSEDDLKLNDEVVVYGTLTKYQTTYEFTSGNYLKSLVRDDTPATDTFGLAGYNYIYEDHEGTYYYMNIDNASSSVKPTAVTSELEASVFLFTLVANDTFTISNGDKTAYLYCTSGSNTVCWGATSTTTWKVDNAAAGELTGTYNLVSNVQDRCLCIYNNQDWRTYTSTTGTNRKAKTEIAEFDYAQEFLTVYTLGCIQAGGYTAENMHWTEAARFYNYLSTADKAVYAGATANQAGSPAERVAARYDYIVGKYGVSTFSDFMSRTPSSPSNPMRSYIPDSSLASTIIIVTAVLGATTLGGYFFLRKKKEN